MNEHKSLKLWSHQEVAIAKMTEKEQQFLQSTHDKKNIGLLCNDVGTGKTRTTLAHILGNPTIMVDYTNALDECMCFPLVICKLIQEYLKDDLRIFYEHAGLFKPHFFHMHQYPRGGMLPPYPPANSLPTNPPFVELESNHENLKSKVDGSKAGGQGSGAELRSMPPIVLAKNLLLEHGITILPSNLIVCPHFLFKDPWKKEIDTLVHLLGKGVSVDETVYVVNRKTDKIDKEEFKTHKIVLCNSNKYAELAKYCDEHRLKWQRVIFDEANAISLPNCSSIDSLFYWGITTTWTELNKIKNKGFIRDKFSRLSRLELQQMIVKVDNEGIDKKCFDFKPFVKRTIICKCNPDHQIINECYPESKLSELMNEELFVEAKEYMIGLVRGGAGGIGGSSVGAYKTAKRRTTNNDDDDNDNGSTPSAPIDPLSLLSILELQLKNINLNRTLSDISKQQRTQTLLARIFQEKMCLRCNKDISNEKGNVEPSFHTECCHLNYCFKCTGEVNNCPICLCDLKNDLSLNDTVDDISGNKALEKRAKHIVMLMKIHYCVDDERDLPISCFQWLNNNNNFCDGGDSDDDDEEERGRGRGGKKTKKRKYFDSGNSVLQKSKRSRIREEIKSVEIETKVSECVEKVCKFIKDDTLSKPSATLKIIEEHDDSRILVFINNVKMAGVLSKQFEEEKISHQVLNGMAGKVVNILEKFKRKEVKVLILNGNCTGRGLNIPMADVQIIYDAKNQQAVTQGTGRTQRHGRGKNSSPLEVYVLKHNKFTL